MNYKTHVIGGITAGLILSNTIANITIETKTILLAYSVVGSLIPDLDHPNSFLGKKLKVVSKPTNTFLGHRSILHAPLVYLLLFFFLKNYIPSILLLGLFVGIFSHIFLDMLNKSGIPIFYPLNKKRINILNIKTNSISEIFVDFAIIAGYIYIIILK